MKKIHKKIIAYQARAFCKALSCIRNHRHSHQFRDYKNSNAEFREYRSHCALNNETQFPSINKAKSAPMARQAKAAREFYRKTDFSGAIEAYKAESAWALWHHMDTYVSRQALVSMFPVTVSKD